MGTLRFSVAPSVSRSNSGGHTYTRKRYPGLNGVLSAMKKLVQKFRADPVIRQFALRITASIPADPRTGQPNRRNFDAIANAVYNWMNTNIQYVRDPVDVEWLQSADVTLAKRAGDCDDHSILAATLLESLGIPSRFVIIQGDPRNPAQYTHVYVEYYATGIWKAFDTTLHSQVGVPAARILGRRTIDLSGIETQKKKIMPELNSNTTYMQRGYLGGLSDGGLGQIPVDPAMLASVAQQVPGIAKDVMNFAECLFAPKTCRNRKRREVRDQMMKWLYSKGVHKVNDTGRDGRYNNSIQLLVGLVQQDPTNGVRIINQYLGQTITPDVVTNVINKYNDFVKAEHGTAYTPTTGSGTTVPVPAPPATTYGPAQNQPPPAQATTTSSTKSNLPLYIGGGVALLGIGTAIVVATRN